MHHHCLASFRTNLTCIAHLVFLSGLSLIIAGCSTGREFQMFQPATVNTSGLYLLRPNSPALALYSFRIDLYKFNGHFKDNDSQLLTSFSLHTGEYIYLKLSPGFYLIHLNERSEHRHIINLESGNTYYTAIDIFNTGMFSLAELRIIEMDREEAANELITQAGRMYAHEASEDF